MVMVCQLGGREASTIRELDIVIRRFTHEGVVQISALGGISFSALEIKHACSVHSEGYASS
jgi:hypothetical protein